MKEFGGLLALSGVVFLFFAWAKGFENDTWSGYPLAVGRVLLAFAMIYFGIRFAS